ncbi:MAG: TldD/PmbA family protein, partial [Propionibacteriales bacterium]|nr:TldD/PmbA family protein [Propionibacteriales bacterium]
MSSTTRSADLVEQALAASSTDDCVVLVTETTQANLRWAHNALTTNGQMHDRTLTVMAIRRDSDRASVGVVTRKINSDADVVQVVGAAERAASTAPPSEDAMPLPTEGTDQNFTDLAEATSIEVYADFARDLGEVFTEARSGGISLFGFAEHLMTTTWLGNSAGIRRRHVQPTGRLELNAKDPTMKRTAWIGRGTRDFTDIDLGAMWPALQQRYDWTERQVDLPAGRYETLLPPSAVADLMIYAHWTSGWRDA